MRTLLVTIVLGLSVVGCQPKPVIVPAPESRSFAEDIELIWPRTLAFLDQHDLEVVEANREQGRIVAIRHAYQDQGWAFCKPARVIDRRNDRSRRNRGRPVSRDARLHLHILASDGGTVVRPKARFTEEQINPFRNLPFTAGCRSKGSLENALLDALDEQR